jgi:hypothetical protein
MNNIAIHFYLFLSTIRFNLNFLLAKTEQTKQLNNILKRISIDIKVPLSIFFTSVMDISLIQKCNTCKEFADFCCNGCNKIFCQNHANEHRQSFYDQLDWLTVDHDDLVHTLDNISPIKETSHQSRKIIDKWEEESIKDIQKKANEARHALIDAIKTHINDVKEKLKLLTEKLNAVNNNHDILFDERNLKQWANELRNLKYEFLTTPTFTVRIHGNKPVVMPIIKIQPDPIYESFPNEQQQKSFGLVPIKRSPVPHESISKQEKPISHTSVDHTDDRFSLSSDHIKILNNGRLIIHDSTKNDASIRGLHEYSQDKHQLFFRIEHMTSNQWIFFGIISKHASFDQQAYMNSSAYGWTGYNCVYLKGKSMPILNGYLSDMKVNDFVELTIDCNKQTLFLWHSRQTYKTKLFIDIQKCPFPWQFLISCRNPHDSVRLLPSPMGLMIKREQDKLNNKMGIKDIDLKNENNYFSVRLGIDTVETV